MSYVGEAEIWDREVIRPRAEPFQPHAGIAVLRGNLAPTGAVIKPAAATPALLQHRGRALVFDSIEDLHARVDDPDLDVDADSVLVLRGCGPRGYPGMPEVANLPLPKKLLEAGIRDMVRICDGRMSGTAYGTVVLHVSPGGRSRRTARPDPHRRRRRPRRRGPPTRRRALGRGARRHAPRPSAATGAFAAPTRGWERLYVDTVLQADTGADLDFLVGSSGDAVSRESH